MLVPVFLPVPGKLVAQIVVGKYTDLGDLLVGNLVQREPEPQLLLDDQLVLTSQPKKQRQRIKDFVDGGLCHFFPHSGLSLLEPLERSHAVSVGDSKNLQPFFRQSLACV